MNVLMEVSVATKDELDVREFSAHESMSVPFMLSVTALSKNADIDLDSAIGYEASFKLLGRSVDGKPRIWTGICSEMHQIDVEESGLTTYRLRIVPRMWAASQRRNHRVFQGKSELDIAKQILGEWGVAIEERIESEYKTRKYRVQYGESDLAFVSRMLEEAGITFYFAEKDGQTQCVLADAAQKNDERAKPIPFRESPNAADKEHVTSVLVSRHVRPGKVTLRDHDYRKPAEYSLGASAATNGMESSLESFHYVPGAFLFHADKGDPTPMADNLGMFRTDEDEAAKLAAKRLAGTRSDAAVASFRTNVIDAAPGIVMRVLDHPHRTLADDKKLLVVSSRLDARAGEELSSYVEVRSADEAYHPPLRHEKPRVMGVESATVVGPPGEEIHVDEFGRVRVQFHWDREGKYDDGSSCWMHVSQPWGGTQFGGTSLARVGQEVVVDFLGGDPDRPIITGRVYTNLHQTPYKLPDNKTKSGWKSNSSPTTGGYNELMFEDKAGKELVHMRAEKDATSRVNHDRADAIGRNDKESIGGNQQHSVDGTKSSTVGQDELTSVIGSFLHMAGGDRVLQTIGGSSSQALTHAISSDRSTTITVGQSTISITPDSITIQSPKLFLNPGDAG